MNLGYCAQKAVQLYLPRTLFLLLFLDTAEKTIIIIWYGERSVFFHHPALQICNKIQCKTRVCSNFWNFIITIWWNCIIISLKCITLSRKCITIWWNCITISLKCITFMVLHHYITEMHHYMIELHHYSLEMHHCIMELHHFEIL